MGIFDRFPYSSTHEMNLDFMLGKATEIAEDMQQVTAGMEQVQAGLSAISEKTEQATQAAAQAAQSASSIEGSVTAAEEAAEEAQMHNESAQTWANNALTYKADCQRAATEAAASSSSAAQAATAAAASEDTIAQYAQAANASAQSAANNNDSAHQYANQASASASNATFHSSNAQTAATNANTSATNAQTAATNAQTAATRAATLKDDCQTLHSMCTTAVDLAGEQAVAAANSAAQAAATKTDVETLVESLPEDFTDLNNTVNQLSDEIDTLDSDVTDLKSAITNDVVLKNGENQVTPQNIEGVTFTKTSEDIPGENIFSSSYLFEEDYYVEINPNTTPPVITHGVWSGVKSYCIPVDGTSKYTFTQARFACLAKGNTLAAEAVGTTQSYATEINTTGASYLFLSYVPGTDFSSLEVHKITTQQVYSDFEMPEWSGIPELKIEMNAANGEIYSIESGIGMNIFSYAELLGEDKYASIVNGKINLTSLSGYNAYLIPADGESNYLFTFCRFAFLVDSDKETTIGDLLQNTTKINSTDASYICFSFSRTSFPLSSYEVKKDITVIGKPKFAYIAGDIANGENLKIESARNNLRKNERIIFEGNIASFSVLKIGLTYQSDLSAIRNYFEINSTGISYYASPASTAVTVQHGLTIANNIQIIWEMTEVASCKLTLISNGNLYEHEFANFVRQTIGNPFVLSSGSALTGCKLSWTCTDLDKEIWMFGDSYFAYSSERWTYYLHQYGYDKNCLLDGFPGEGGVNGRVSFANLLAFGTPKYAVWCLGMNDSSDSSSAPSSNWENARDAFLNSCSYNGVEPIFGTIPTVPTINHEQKNAWIRSSGYRYIDFAKAVGANSSGVWYGDMLSNDGVHPSETGAKALFAQVLLDLPEIMLEHH